MNAHNERLLKVVEFTSISGVFSLLNNIIMVIILYCRLAAIIIVEVGCFDAVYDLWQSI